MLYRKPTVTDYGPITAHTFSGSGAPRKDTRLCTKDTHGEESCPDTGGGGAPSP